MNTFSNNTTLNGWRVPGSGTWVTQDNPVDDFYVDEHGDLWVPCLCGEGEGETGSGGGLGRVEGPPLAREAARGEKIEPCVIRYQPDRGGSFVLVNYPEDILYYPGRSLPPGRAMGMLADAGKGARWFYKGAHSGKVRLHISQRNATDRTAGSPEPVYPGVPLRYAILLENHGEAPAIAAIQKQGACIGDHPNAAQIAYFKSRALKPFGIPPMSRVWLYLGEGGFLRDEGGQALIGPGCRIEAQLDLEFNAGVTVICCAYEEKAEVDPARASFWPLPKTQAATGAGGVWQLEGSFAWALDDATRDSPAALLAAPAYDEGKGHRGWVTNVAHAAERETPHMVDREEYFAVREDVVPLGMPVAAPAGDGDPDRALFEPPPGPVAVESRGGERCPGLANRGVMYHQIFTVENRGKHGRRVQYYVTGAGGPDRRACIHHVNEDRVVSYVSSGSEPVPDALVANVLVPAGEKRAIETCFISDGALGHRLTANG